MSASNRSVKFSFSESSTAEAPTEPPQDAAAPPTTTVGAASAAHDAAEAEPAAVRAAITTAEPPTSAPSPSAPSTTTPKANAAAPPEPATPAPPAALKSAMKSKDRIGGAPRRSAFVYCEECGQNVPVEEWPDHRDRLRKVNMVEQVSTFHERIVRFFGELLMWILRSVYFREVTVVGRENIPRAGAVVFYGNHQNQFIDALMMNSHCGRPVRFLMAEKAFHQPVIGRVGRLFNSVPVIRPQDVPLVPGEGVLIKTSDRTILGEGTKFSKLRKGDVLVWAVPACKKVVAQVSRICSDAEVEVTVPIPPEHVVCAPTSYNSSRRIDHSEMYAKVYDTLQKNDCIGIFPEGGSHDHTSLLPLKAGVALFSLGAAERHISVQIVPVGLTYLYGHKFRSRAYIEFGEPISPPAELVRLFDTDKRKATGLFLEQLNAALRAVTINVPDYQTLNFLHSFRQLYQPPNCTLSARDYLRLIRRLSNVIEEKKGSPDFIEFREKVENYSDFCSALMVRDSQAATLKQLLNADSETPQVELLLRRTFALYLMAVILVPFFLVGLPIGGVVKYFALKRTKQARSASAVKIVGADVTGSFKILISFVVVPAAFMFVSLVVFLYTDLRTALVVFFSLPMAMYVSLLILQEAIMELRAALPLFMSLVSRHKQFKKLYERREDLAKQARAIVHKYDPQLEEEMKVYVDMCDSDNELDREPSLFSLRYSVRRRQATNA
ncbi:putative glycerol-3-phosphate acyltransferase [Leptomonas pyrrhocoris]|uniref:Putative glycerol-3-phosphate acyltransferase n=1 Tax=Leptomonas pyrrhocoris TaxID=157538 RepID=A0A0M9FQ34_LEPPY|nr:putative glycerol-3-phosphate acyltransferase [Leptomonas pyrrhocoris]KPA73576.1 putative glycerol-3-phosphate acyltransferase [Leptomonas pyrrhocoris]|eukprot:XP_015652015.1 putative glycerol-3-phosphate acyltransferase [Leptomonas pyrrhocoris]